MSNLLIDVIEEFEEFVVISKSGGLLSVPGRGPDKADCAVSRFKEIYPHAIDQPAIHRLDMETSGILVMAITKEAHRRISIMFQNREVDKKYEAILEGLLEDDAGTISLPFRLDIDNRPYQIYDPIYGKMGVTEWKKISEDGDRTRVEFKPITGRTHQLRVHSAHKLGLNSPIVGDCLYGSGVDYYNMCLHAKEIKFRHPFTDEILQFNSPVPF